MTFPITLSYGWIIICNAVVCTGMEFRSISGLEFRYMLDLASWKSAPKSSVHLYTTNMGFEDARECPLNLFIGALLPLFDHGGDVDSDTARMDVAPSYSRHTDSTPCIDRDSDNPLAGKH